MEQKINIKQLAAETDTKLRSMFNRVMGREIQSSDVIEPFHTPEFSFMILRSDGNKVFAVVSAELNVMSPFDCGFESVPHWDDNLKKVVA